MLGSRCQLGEYSCIFKFDTIYVFDISAEPLGDFKEPNYNHLFLSLIEPQRVMTTLVQRTCPTPIRETRHRACFLQPRVLPWTSDTQHGAFLPAQEKAAHGPQALVLLSGTGKHNKLAFQNMGPQSRLHPNARCPLWDFFPEGPDSVSRCRN